MLSTLFLVMVDVRRTASEDRVFVNRTGNRFLHFRLWSFTQPVHVSSSADFTMSRVLRILATNFK